MNALALSTLLQSFSTVSATATAALVSAIWQGAVLAIGVGAGLRLFPRLSAAARSMIWFNVFGLLIALHLVPLFGAHAIAASSSHTVHMDWRWSLAIGAAWVALSASRAMQLAIGALHVRGLARRAVPLTVDEGLQAVLAMRGARAAELCSSTEVVRPSVFGFLRPRILVPPALLHRLSAQELQQVVVHEMEHLHRGDDWTNLLQKIGLVLFPLNPVLLWVERKVCAERELACDDRVLASSNGRKAYAVCLTRLAEFTMLRHGLSLVLGAWERRPELVRRVHRILRVPAASMGRKRSWLVTGGLVSGALGCALLLAHSPQLVSFVPAPTASQALTAVPHDLRELSREMGGTPQLVKAVLPSPRSGHSPTQTRKTVLKRSPHPRMLQQVRETQPVPMQRTVVVLTEWHEIESPTHMIIRVADGSRTGYVAIPAAYAVATPNGWLIIQI
jgi:beta-lactamase regulating signal transducer with metallopeptidase domain